MLASDYISLGMYCLNMQMKGNNERVDNFISFQF